MSSISFAGRYPHLIMYDATCIYTLLDWIWRLEEAFSGAFDDDVHLVAAFLRGNARRWWDDFILKRWCFTWHDVKGTMINQVDHFDSFSLPTVTPPPLPLTLTPIRSQEQPKQLAELEPELESALEIIPKLDAQPAVTPSPPMVQMPDFLLPAPIEKFLIPPMFILEVQSVLPVVYSGSVVCMMALLVARRYGFGLHHQLLQMNSG